MLKHPSSSTCRAASKTATLLALVLLAALLSPGRAVAQHTWANASQTNAGSLNYTGALFGYYRVDPDQPTPSLVPPHVFLEKRKYQHSALLLGMGDNFGPEFGASVQEEFGKTYCELQASRDDPDWHNNVAPQAIYKDSRRLPTMAECDNVGRFLMQAGYRAIVPGKEDFLYSARWLRRMAILFRGASYGQGWFPENDRIVSFRGLGVDRVKIDNPDHKLVMLAANLRVNFKVDSLYENPGGGTLQGTLNEQVKSICPLFFRWDLLGARSETCVAGGAQSATVATDVDWLSRLDLAIRPDRNCVSTSDTDESCLSVARSLSRQAWKDKAFRKQLLENEATIASSAFYPGPDGVVCPYGTGDAQDLASAAEDDASALIKWIENASMDGPASPPSLSDEVIHASHSLRTTLPSSEQACQEWHQDLMTVLRDLHVRFSFWNPHVGAILGNPAPDTSFLVSLGARKASIRLLLRRIGAEQKDVGYTIAGDGSLIVGVIGQEAVQAISPGNLELCTSGFTDTMKGARTKDLDACDPLPTPPSNRYSLDFARLKGSITVGDPVSAVTSAVRGAWALKDLYPFCRVVVMAQMPHSEAEELATKILTSLGNTRDRAELKKDGCIDGGTTTSTEPRVDLVISEAQPGSTTPTLDLDYARKSVIPVVSPNPASHALRRGPCLKWPVSSLQIEVEPGANDRALHNTLETYGDPEPTECSSANPPKTMAENLKDLLMPPTLRVSDDLTNLNTFWGQCDTEEPCRNSVMAQYLLEQIHRSSKADVVLAEYRDLYFGDLLKGYDHFEGYDGYAICDRWVTNPPQKIPPVPDVKSYCQLRIALDRVLWKGDYSERVMVDGKTLKDMLAKAQQESSDELSLAARDTVQEWLLTFGVVTQPPKNLAAASMGPETFFVPGAPFCASETSNTEGPQYCVNGQHVTDDGAYWVATSDHLAEDTQVYKLLNALDPKYHELKRARKNPLFLTAEIADEILIHGSSGLSAVVSQPDDAEEGISQLEVDQQKRPILQLDYAKIVAGFMMRQPSLSNSALKSNFLGVADSRATTPSAQELDLEGVARMTRGLWLRGPLQALKFGIQSDFEYDRAVTGNINGNPETVTYALNSVTTGGFLQMRVSGDRTSPRLFVVLAPGQYQQQIAGNYLNLSLTPPPTGPPVKGQITVASKRWEGFSQRAGLRLELGGTLAGSYFEAGYEYTTTNNVLSALLFPDGTKCPLVGALFTACINGETIVATTAVTPITQNVRAGGGYWDVHVQDPLDKAQRFSLTFETKGDSYAESTKTLPTQTKYAFTTTAAINFKLVGNLVFSPTVKTFFYRNQGTDADTHSLITNTFAVTAKWYFARDAAVPVPRQLWFRGPASFDQTKSAKMQ